MLCINCVNYVKTLGLYANKTVFDLFFNIVSLYLDSFLGIMNKIKNN